MRTIVFQYSLLKIIKVSSCKKPSFQIIQLKHSENIFYIYNYEDASKGNHRY
jgi:hypothetical protein